LDFSNVFAGAQKSSRWRLCLGTPESEVKAAPNEENVSFDMIYLQWHML
jgi:hypothetical protein